MIALTKLILLGLVVVVCGAEFYEDRGGVEVVGFDEIGEGRAMIAELGVEQSDEEVRVHLEGFGEVHGG